MENGKLIIPPCNATQSILTALEGKEVSVTIERYTKTRTSLQNRSLHLYFKLLAQELNGAGFDMKKVISPEIDIEWSPYSIKESLFRPLMKTMFGKRSTTKLTTKEIDDVYKNLDKIISERTGVSVEWPCLESLMNKDVIKIKKKDL